MGAWKRLYALLGDYQGIYVLIIELGAGFFFIYVIFLLRFFPVSRCSQVLDSFGKF